MRPFLLLLLLLIGCQKTDTPAQKTLRISLTTDPRTLDPRKARDLIDCALVRMLFEGLTRSATELALAESVTISDDLTTYTFHLRNSYWSNEEPVTSFDFAKSWKRVLDPHFPADNAEALFCLRHGKQAKLGEVDIDEVGIETPDASTLIVHLEKPLPYFLDLLILPCFLPVCSKVADTSWVATPATFVCNGPFRLAAWQPSHLLQLVKNEHYWQADQTEMGALDFYVVDEDTGLRMFELGKLDWTGSPLALISPDALHELRKEGALRTQAFCSTSFFRVNTAPTFKNTSNPLHSSSFRKALSLALHREEIVEHVLQGGQMSAKGLVPPVLGLSEEGYFRDNDLEAARICLAEALRELGLTQEALAPICLTYRPTQINNRLAQAVQRQWESKLGLQILLESTESKVFFQRIAGLSYQLALSNWSADFADPVNFLEMFKEKASALNNTGWEDGKYIALLNRSALCRDLKERTVLLREAEQILMEQMPIIPLYHNAMNYLQSDRLENVALSPLGYVDFRRARLGNGEKR